MSERYIEVLDHHVDVIRYNYKGVDTADWEALEKHWYSIVLPGYQKKQFNDGSLVYPRLSEPEPAEKVKKAELDAVKAVFGGYVKVIPDRVRKGMRWEYNFDDQCKVCEHYQQGLSVLGKQLIKPVCRNDKLQTERGVIKESYLGF